MGATLAGGHTIEGPQTMIGYTIIGEGRNATEGGRNDTEGVPYRIRTKSVLRPGDVLVLTKPLGIGVLLAAQMQARLKAEWYEPLIAALLASNQPAAEALDDFDVPAATDVTGFGLAGHLLEMLEASNVSAKIELGNLPLLEGTIDLFAEGLQSTLAPANRTAQRAMSADNVADLLAYPALFDPQTCGGLLFCAGRTDRRHPGPPGPYADSRHRHRDRWAGCQGPAAASGLARDGIIVTPGSFGTPDENLARVARAGCTDRAQRFDNPRDSSSLA